MEGKTVLNYPYNSEHFYTRLTTLQLFCKINSFDAILLIMGVDGGFDPEMKKLASWLIRGSHPLEPVTDEKLDDCIFVVAQDAFYVYCTKSAGAELAPLCAKVPNVVYYCLRKKDELDADKAEMIKMGQFYKMIHDKKVVGIPLAIPDINSDFYYDRNSEHYVNKVIESWPLVQAYALESIGGSFFSIKHKLVNIREKLSEIYKTQDAYTMARLLNVTVPTVEGVWEQCFGILSRTVPTRRLDLTEANLAAELYLPYELGFMSFDSTDLASFERKDGLSHPRVLVGKNTNSGRTARSSTEPKIEYYNGKGDPPCHFICEGVDYHTSMRWARTYFLHNLVKGYMKDIEYTHKTDPIKGMRSDKTELDVDLLSFLYTKLVSSFSLLAEKINTFQLKTVSNVKDLLYLELCEHLKEGCYDPGNTIDKSNIDIALVGYNCLGQPTNVYTDDLISVKDWSLYVLKLGVTHIKAPHGEDIGGICYADSFIFLDETKLVNLTENIPQVQGWFTSSKHYPLMDYNPERVYLIEFPKFGKRIAKYELVSGTFPLEKPFGKQHEALLRGTALLHEHGIIFQDQRLNSLFVLFSEVVAIKFIAKDSVNLEIEFKEKERLPLPEHSKGKLILIMPRDFVKDVCYQYFESLKDLVFYSLFKQNTYRIIQ